MIIGVSLSDAIDEFILDQRVRGNSSATIDYYTFSLGLFSRYVGADHDVSDLTLRVCKEYYIHLIEDKTVNSVSIQSYIRGLRTFLRWLYDQEYIDTNICEKFKLPKATRKVIDVLSDEEIDKLLAALSGDEWLTVRNRLIVALMLDSGLRLNEVVTLRRSCVHISDRYLIVTGKGDKQRVVPFGEFTAKTIVDYLAVTDQACYCDALIIKVSETLCGFEGITQATIKNMFRRLKARAGIPRLYPHLLRHTFATRYLENGGNIYTLQAILGHTSLEMVKKYLHLATNRIRSDFPKFSPLDNIKKDPL
ncbi:MAG: tyrosine-type recombinase/integrase [Clostridia bacterium]|nr:tyrosine-type recombinase/integrase [Clostridia bacterium]